MLEFFTCHVYFFFYSRKPEYQIFPDTLYVYVPTSRVFFSIDTLMQYNLAVSISTGLFHRAISQSATALVYWANGVSQRRVAERQAAVVDCGTSSSTHQLVQCLREVPAERLIRSGDTAFKVRLLPC